MGFAKYFIESLIKGVRSSDGVVISTWDDTRDSRGVLLPMEEKSTHTLLNVQVDIAREIRNEKCQRCWT